jgi:pimeloyl-ACP methyl ester carboxylesterase
VSKNLLLVHGAWHGAWCWERLTPVLEAYGWNVSTVDLPSASTDPSTNAGMYDDAAAIRERLERIDGPVVVVAHSYGGMPATEAAATATNVVRLIYLAAFQPDAGESVVSIVRSAGVELPTGSVGSLPPLEDPIPSMYGTTDGDTATRAAERLVPQTVRSFNETLTQAAWHSIPSAHIVCEQDQAIPRDPHEAMAARADAVHRLASDHSPFMSMPTELASLITTLAAPTPARPASLARTGEPT